MKRAIFTFIMLLAMLQGFAQTVDSLEIDTIKSQISNLKPQITNQSQIIIGYLSYNDALKAMPQYAIMEKQMAELRTKYDEEMKRVEDEFNQKYEAFLEGRKDFPRTILLKRQTELQQLLQRNIDFKEQCRQDLEQARKQAMAPLREKLTDAIAYVARKNQLMFVLNTDSDACPFIDQNVSVDISDDVLSRLNR